MLARRHKQLGSVTDQTYWAAVTNLGDVSVEYQCHLRCREGQLLEMCVKWSNELTFLISGEFTDKLEAKNFCTTLDFFFYFTTNTVFMSKGMHIF